MQAEGIVLRLGCGVAYVKVRRSAGCGRCHEPGGCGGGDLVTESQCAEFLVDNACGAKEGQRVLLEVPEGATAKAALVTYGLPLCSGLICAGLAHGIFSSDLAAAGALLVGLTVPVISMRWLRPARQNLCRIVGVSN